MPLCIKCINCVYIILLNAVAIKIQYLNFKIDFVCSYFLSASLLMIDADF